MLQQAFGFLLPAPILELFVSHPGSLVPPPEQPFLHSERLPLVHEPPAPPHTVSHIPPPAPSTKNP